LNSDPELLQKSSFECTQILHQAAIANRVETVRLIVQLGFDLAAFGDSGASALHHAAWHGNVETVRLLLEYHAPVNIRDAVYGTSPLSWAAHGSAMSKNWREGDDNYRAVARMLIAAGAA
jgi:ankyrin repeat protein